MKVRVVFSRRPTFSSWLLRRFLWSDWSHCGVEIDGHVYEATAKHGVIRRSLLEFKRGTDGYDEFEVTVTESQKRLLLVAATTQLGRGYDWFGALGIAFHRRWDEDDLWFCSELVAWLFNQIGKPLVYKPGWRVTPPDIYQTPRAALY